MTTLGNIGRGVLGLGIGGLGFLAGMKVRENRRVDALWRSLEEMGAPGEPFREEMVADLPDPARRYFLHAIRPGTPLVSTLHWQYTGELRTGRNAPWMRLEAEQIIVRERGFVWKARVSKGPVLLTGADHYLDGDARMRIALYGLIPVVNAGGTDINRSALGRLMIESTNIPSALLPGPHVRIEGLDASRFVANISLHGETTRLTLTVDEEGRVLQTTMPRWGNVTGDGSHQYIPYGGYAGAERTFGGYTIPAELRVGWWFGTERYLEVVRLTLDWASLR